MLVLFFINKSLVSLSINLIHFICKDLWEIQGDCKNYNVLHGHKNAVLEAKWLTETTIVSCSADKTVINF